MSIFPKQLSLRSGYPDFQELPWDKPIEAWEGCCPQLVKVPHGFSRHPVAFINIDGVLYAIKEMQPGAAQSEYEILRQIEDANLPAVLPVGSVHTETTRGDASVLITKYLERSLPYSLLFTRPSLEQYREHLLDAITGLLVQLHLAGVFWGDCSLSNTLFRRDAGTLKAYLVDAETAEIHPEYFSPALRLHDLQIMEENVHDDLFDLQASGLLSRIDPEIPAQDTGAVIRLRYQRLWEEITREDIISPSEHYLIQERISALNGLGFSIDNVELTAAESGDQLRLRVMVADRSFHRDQLYNLTGLDVEEGQARKLVNEIQEVRATLSRANNRSTPLSMAAFHWLEDFYSPVAVLLEPLLDPYISTAELYCQILEHKWYLSEQANQDVGHQAAAHDYLDQFGAKKRPGD